MKRYHVVIFKARPERVEVVLRDYDDLSPCHACGHTACTDRMRAAQQDGLEFGEMLMRVGSQGFRCGLLKALTV